MGLFLNDKKKSHCEKLLYHSAKGRHAQHAEDAHDAPGQQHAAHDIKNDRRFLREILGKAFTVHGHYLRFFHRLRRRGLFRARSLYI